MKLSSPIAFLLLFILFSCSSEEAPTSNIVGTWAFYGVTEVTTTGDEVESIAGECAQKSRITFKTVESS